MNHPSLLGMLSFCWSFCCLGLNGLLQPELVLEWLCVVIRHVIVKVPVHAAFMHAYAAGLPEHFKKDGHLLTTSPDLMPSLGLQKLASMGSKYRLSPYPGEFNSTTKQEVLCVLHDPILA